VRALPIAIRFFAGLLAAVAPLATAAAPTASEGLAFRWLPLGERADAPRALARADDGRLALGDERGVLLGRPGAGFRRVRLRGAVRDLAFTADGALFAATGVGLVRIDGAGGPREIGPGPGAAARSVRRIALASGLRAVATDGGVYLASEGARWRRAGGSLPAGPAAAVALQRLGAELFGWAVIAGELWRFDARAAAAGAAVTQARRVVMPLAGDEGAGLDLHIAGDGALVVVHPRLFARAADPGAASPVLAVVRPELPPGARARRLASGPGGLWLATDRGLLAAAELAGPWRRAAPPAGTAITTSVLAAGGLVAAAGEDGLLLGTPAPAAAAAPAGPPAAGGARAPAPAVADPPIGAVHRAAVRYLGLERSRLEALRRGVLRRSRWPLLTVRAGGAWDRGRDVDHDQSFVSGDYRFLTDESRDRDRGYDLTLTLTWDLGGLDYDPEAIDVSRETREVIELRDDVLDEITQLYFERRAALAALAEPGTAAGDAATLRRRAAALAAGIDAWTGGWFGAQLAEQAP
jgi:hypothetical protein